MGSRSRGRRKSRGLGNTAQRSLGLAEEVREPATAAVEGHFLPDDPRDLWIDDRRLSSYLRNTEMDWAIRLRAELEQLDYSGALGAYAGSGRRALHPRVLIGLIVYGILLRQWSLRDLEGLARRDLGAWWICGGHQPDHSTIGKFIQLHNEWLSEEFFTSLVKHLVGKFKAKPGTVAGDGTVVEAASSYLRALRAEAARAKATATMAEAARHREDADLQEQAVAAAEVVRVASERLAERQTHGGTTEAVLIVPQEVEAVVQRCKDGRNRPSYKPSLLRHESGLIVAQYVHASSETAALAAMLRQHQQIFGAVPARLLLDAGYFSLAVLELVLAYYIDLLCPSGKRGKPKRSPQGRFGKGDFHYVAERDVFQCPAGRELTIGDYARDSRGRPYRRYRGRQCADCPLRSGCTSSAAGRTLRRYEGDELKEAMEVVMSQSAARRAYRRRAELAERPFAEQRERQGLRRFHRRGLRGVRVEFSLHCVAFNLKLLVWGSSGLQLHTITFFFFLAPSQLPTVAALLWSIAPLS
jgi:transposase